MKKTTDIELGDIAKDLVTGFKGVVIAKTEWLNGCLRLTLQPQELREGKPIESQTLDAEQLMLVKRKGIDVGERSGGPCPAPSRHPVPKR